MKNPVTTKKTNPRRALVDRVDHHIRAMAAQTVVTSQIVAGHFGLHTTDLRVLDLIFMRGQVSAGELASATGLTTGSVTALIDRLEKAGYVERHRDPTDRRKVWVRSRPDAIEPIVAVFAPSQIRLFELWSTFSENQLETIANFLERTTLLAAQSAEDLRRNAEPRADAGEAPRRRRGSTPERAEGNGRKKIPGKLKHQRRNHDDPRT